MSMIKEARFKLTQGQVHAQPIPGNTVPPAHENPVQQPAKPSAECPDDDHTRAQEVHGCKMQHKDSQNIQKGPTTDGTLGGSHADVLDTPGCNTQGQVTDQTQKTDKSLWTNLTVPQSFGCTDPANQFTEMSSQASTGESGFDLENPRCSGRTRE
jgi:hypothetical protein